MLRGSGIETEQKEGNEGSSKTDVKMTARVNASWPKLQFSRGHLHLREQWNKVCSLWVLMDVWAHEKMCSTPNQACKLSFQTQTHGLWYRNPEMGGAFPCLSLSVGHLQR